MIIVFLSPLLKIKEMITVDQMEVLLRTVPQYILFAAISIYIFGWMEKKERLGYISDSILIIGGILALLVMLSGMIPSPKEVGMNAEHIQRIIKVLFLFVINGSLATFSLIWRFIKKSQLKPLVFLIFAIGIIIFFQSTSLSKVKFELNKTEIPTDTISINSTNN